MIILQDASRRAAKARRRISASFTRTHHTLERPAIRSLQLFYRDVTQSVLRRLKRARSTAVQPEELFDPAGWQRPFVARFHRHWNAAVWTGVEFEAAWVASQQPEEQAARLIRQDLVGGVDTEAPLPPPSIHVDVSPELQRQVRDWLQDRRAGVWNQVGRTTHDRIRRSLQAGLRDGDTLNQLQGRLRETMKSLSGVQARRIARTETTGSMNFGGQAERDELGITHKQWVSTIDQRNRGVDPKSPWDHLTPDGQSVPNSGAFLVSGEELRFPGDNSGSAGNVINCRCCAVGDFDGGGGGTRFSPSSSPAPADNPPPSITFSGEPTELSKRVWGAIGDGIRDERHARVVGSILRKEIRKALKPAEKRLASLKQKERRLERRVKKSIRRGNYTVELSRKLTKASRLVRDTETAVSLQQQQVVLDHLWQVRDLGGRRLELTGQSDLFTAIRHIEQQTPSDWLAKLRRRGALDIGHSNRGGYHPVAHRIELESASSLDTALHEMMHAVEDTAPKLRTLTVQFGRRRTRGDGLTGIRPFNRRPNREVGYKDRFQEHYIGKSYGPDAEFHEILSMGWEGLVYRKWGIHIDTDMMDFILGILAGA